MATLKITDGTNNVDLLDSAGLYLADNSWWPKVAKQNAAGDGYEDVTENIPLRWMPVTDDARDTTAVKINQLAEKARTYIRKRKTTNPVWLEMKTPSSSSSLYALIVDINMEKLDTRHWGPNQPVNLTLFITREGAWRDTTPADLQPIVLNGETITNQEDSGAGTKNYVTLNTTTHVKGDALGIPYIKLGNPSSTLAQETIIVAAKSAETQTELDNFTPNFYPDSFTGTTNLVADGTIPGGQRYYFDNPLPVLLTDYVNIPLPYDVANYEGDYLMYMVAKATVGGTAPLVIAGQAITPSGTAGPVVHALNDGVTIQATNTDFVFYYLGNLSIPFIGRIPNLATPGTDSYCLTLQIDLRDVSTLEIIEVFIVPVNPVHGSPFVLSTYLAEGHAIDSNIERAYTYTSSDEYSDNNPTALGKYPLIPPAQFTRLYFWMSHSDGGTGMDITDTLEIKVGLTRRYLAIRGNL